MISLVIFSFIFLQFLFYLPRTDYYLPRWWLLCQAAACFMAWDMALASSLYIGFFCFYLMSSALFYSVNYDNGHPCRDFKEFRYECVLTFVFITCLSVVYLKIPDWLFLNFDIVALLVLPYGIIKTIKRKHFPMYENGSGYFLYGFSGNSSVNATLVSIFSMFLFFNFDRLVILKIIMLFFTGFALAKTKSAGGLVGFIVGVLSFVCLTISPFFLLCLLPIPLLDKKFFSLSGRMKIWKIVYRNLFKSRPLYGSGVGSASYLIPAIQYRDNIFMPDKNGLKYVFYWGHNDYLQLIAEAGLVGGLILFFVIVDLVGMSWGNPACFAFIACYAVNSLCNYPVHMAPDAFLLVVFGRIVYY